MTIEQAIEAEAQAQAICMQTQDFRAPTRPSRPSRSPSSGGLRWQRPSARAHRPPGPALLRRGPPHTGRGLRAWAAAARTSMKPTTAPPAATGCAAGRRRLAALLRAAEHGGALPNWILARWWCCARRWPSIRRWPTLRLPCRAGQRRDHAGRHARAAGAYLPAVARGEKIAAFALSEPDAGSDVAAMQTVAARRSIDAGIRPKRFGFCASGRKTWISNGGMADFYCVFAKTDPQGGSARHQRLHRGRRTRRAWTPAAPSM
jgi:hypothetical protein